MNIFHSIARVLVLLFALSAAGGASAQTTTGYKGEIEQWHRQRIDDLKSENGWLNIAGLYWLAPGKNTFGSGAGAKIRFPEGAIPAQAGYFHLADGVVTIVAENGVVVTVNGKPMQQAVIFHKDSARAPDARYGDLKWNIIKREDKFGVRLRYLKSAAVNNFKGIERYVVDPAWKVSAALRPAVAGGVSITNVLGQTSMQASPGKLVFSIGGKSYILDALDGGQDELFIIFGDETNGVETYPSGRYVYVKRPGSDGITTIDFNKAYNPPCAFTDHATCPLPPPQNLLLLAVTAGEKNYGMHK